MLKHMQRTTFTAKGYGRAREESVHLFLFSIYQMEAVIPIQRVIVIFCNYYNFVIQYRYYILCVCRSIKTIAVQL